MVEKAGVYSRGGRSQSKPMECQPEIILRKSLVTLFDLSLGLFF